MNYKSNEVSYKPLTQDSFTEALYSMAKQMDKDSRREFVIGTSLDGVKLFNLAIRREMLNTCLERIKDQLKDDYYTTIKAMINSPDEENLTIAQSILETNTILSL